MSMLLMTKPLFALDQINSHSLKHVLLMTENILLEFLWGVHVLWCCWCWNLFTLDQSNSRSLKHVLLMTDNIFLEFLWRVHIFLCCLWQNLSSHDQSNCQISNSKYPLLSLSLMQAHSRKHKLLTPLKHVFRISVMSSRTSNHCRESTRYRSCKMRPIVKGLVTWWCQLWVVNPPMTRMMQGCYFLLDVSSPLHPSFLVLNIAAIIGLKMYLVINCQIANQYEILVPFCRWWQW